MDASGWESRNEARVISVDGDTTASVFSRNTYSTSPSSSMSKAELLPAANPVLAPRAWNLSPGNSSTHAGFGVGLALSTITGSTSTPSEAETDSRQRLASSHCP